MRFLMTLCAMFYAVLATSAAAHDLEVSGDADHTHQGELCALCKINDRPDDDLILPEGITLTLPTLEHAYQAFQAEALIVPTVTAHPPGRAPPLS